jgi:hypothetical protein
MKLHEEVLRIRELLGEEKEQKIFTVPGLEFFHEDPWEAWNILQKVLEARGNPPYSIDGDLDLSNTPIKSLGNLISVGGYLYLKDSPIESLGNLTSVEGFLNLLGTPIKSLGNLETVGDELILHNTPIETLGKLKSVGGALFLSETSIESLENLKSVGLHLFLINTPLSEKYTKEQIRQMVNVGGEIFLKS